jgi:O-antigen/teichoic acid export membrane protein
VTALAGPTLQERVFLGQPLLVAGLILGAVGYLVANLTEGVLSGNGRWARYGAYLGVEASTRLIICVALVVLGVRTAGPIGLALGGAPILTTLALMTGRRELAPKGPDVPWGELASGLGALLFAALFSQIIINASPVLVGFVAGPDRTAEAGVFTTALVVARVPLFVFQAIQVAMLPKLSGLAAEGRFDDLRSAIARLAGIVAALIAVGTAVGLVLGPSIIVLAFGDKYVIGHKVVGLLTVASGGYVMATALSLAIIALGGSRPLAVGWLIGVVTMFVTVLFGVDPIMRVTIAFTASTWVTALAAALILRHLLRRGATLRSGPVLDAINDISLEA